MVLDRFFSWKFCVPAIFFQNGLEVHLPFLKSNGSSPLTIQQFRLRNKVFLDFLSSIGVRRFEEITPGHAYLFRSHVRQPRGTSTTSDTTSAGYYKCVRAMLRFLMSRDLIKRASFVRLKFPRPPFRRSVKPTLAELNRILKKVDPRFETFSRAIKP